jgi:hypothetical protein
MQSHMELLLIQYIGILYREACIDYLFTRDNIALPIDTQSIVVVIHMKNVSHKITEPKYILYVNKTTQEAGCYQKVTSRHVYIVF